MCGEPASQDGPFVSSRVRGLVTDALHRSEKERFSQTRYYSRRNRCGGLKSASGLRLVACCRNFSLVVRRCSVLLLSPPWEILNLLRALVEHVASPQTRRAGGVPRSRKTVPTTARTFTVRQSPLARNRPQADMLESAGAARQVARTNTTCSLRCRLRGWGGVGRARAVAAAPASRFLFCSGAVATFFLSYGDGLLLASSRVAGVGLGTRTCVSRVRSWGCPFLTFARCDPRKSCWGSRGLVASSVIPARGRDIDRPTRRGRARLRVGHVGYAGLQHWTCRRLPSAPRPFVFSRHLRSGWFGRRDGAAVARARARLPRRRGPFFRHFVLVPFRRGRAQHVRGLLEPCEAWRWLLSVTHGLLAVARAS